MNSNRSRYLEEIINQMIHYSTLNFDHKLDIVITDEADDLISGLALGVNILGEELKDKVEELKRLNKELENRNNFIKSVTSTIPEIIYILNKETSTVSYLNKCSSDDVVYPCPVIIMGLSEPCVNCKIKTLMEDTRKNSVVDIQETNEIKISSSQQGDKWYHLTQNTFEMDESGKEVSTIYTLSDITLVKEKSAIIANSLNEKELLLQEVHHRVKNNLQLIASLIIMQANRTNSDVVQKHLRTIQSRVYSISLVHEELYMTDNFSVNIAKYCVKLCSSLASLYSSRLTVEFDLEPDVVFKHDKATSFGLLMHEVISNCYKHNQSDPGKIWVSLKREGSFYHIQIRDNGSSDIVLTKKSEGTLGIKLIKAITLQLKGEVEMMWDNGYVVKLIIPKDLD